MAIAGQRLPEYFAAAEGSAMNLQLRALDPDVLDDFALLLLQKRSLCRCTAELFRSQRSILILRVENPRSGERAG